MVNLMVGTKDFNVLDKLIAGWRLKRMVNQISKNDKVLDFGCGSQGYLLRQIKDRIKSGTGMDYDIEDKIEGNLSWVQGRFVDKLPFENGVFDKVVSLAVIEHLEIEVVDNLFKEVSRVLKRDGRWVLTTPTMAGKRVLEFLAGLNVISRKEVMDHKKYYNKTDLDNLAQKSGLLMLDYQLFQFGLNSVAIFKKA